MTYAENRGIIRDRRRLLLFGRRRAFFDPQVLDICAAEDDVLVELVGGGDELLGVCFPVLGTKRPHVFKGDGRVIRVDAVEGAGIARQKGLAMLSRPAREGKGTVATYRMSLRDMREILAL
jgi:hypothetical protein